MIYVLSDVHGNSDRFYSIMKQIDLKPEDTLYVLGDVIDRYPVGIHILRQIMKMPNVKMLLGNHEYMMLNALDSSYAEGTKQPQQMKLNLWYRNGGFETHSSYEHLTETEKKEVMDYLKSLPLNYKIEVNGQKFLLVHGSPIENYSIVQHDKVNETAFAVWYRWFKDAPIPDGFTLVFGHTPTEYFQSRYPSEVWFSENKDAIGIDCGGAYEDGRLACIRLNDMKVFYSKE